MIRIISGRKNYVCVTVSNRKFNLNGNFRSTRYAESKLIGIGCAGSNYFVVVAGINRYSDFIAFCIFRVRFVVCTVLSIKQTATGINLYTERPATLAVSAASPFVVYFAKVPPTKQLVISVRASIPTATLMLFAFFIVKRPP